MPNTRRDKGSELTHEELDDNFALKRTQASHGFTVGDLVYLNGSTWTKAVASAAASTAIGMVSDYIDASNFAVAFDGHVDFTHGITVGLDVFLHQSTAGGSTGSAPTTGIRQRVGVAISSTEFLLRIEEARDLG